MIINQASEVGISLSFRFNATTTTPLYSLAYPLADLRWDSVLFSNIGNAACKNGQAVPLRSSFVGTWSVTSLPTVALLPLSADRLHSKHGRIYTRHYHPRQLSYQPRDPQLRDISLIPLPVLRIRRPHTSSKITPTYGATQLLTPVGAYSGG